MILPTKSMVDQDILREISIKDWSQEIKEYIRICNQNNLLASPEHFFLLHAYVFDISEGEDTRFMSK